MATRASCVFSSVINVRRSSCLRLAIPRVRCHKFVSFETEQRATPMNVNLNPEKHLSPTNSRVKTQLVTAAKRSDVERPTWIATEGSAVPLGAHWLPDARSFNFALYSKHATSVTLLLFRDDDLEAPAVCLELNYLTNKSGRIWHCRVPHDVLCDVCYYAYRIDGPANGSDFDLHAFDREKILVCFRQIPIASTGAMTAKCRRLAARRSL